MKWLYIAFFIFMLLVGGSVLFQERTEARDAKEIKNYVESKGRTPVPSKWRQGGDYGKGI